MGESYFYIEGRLIDYLAIKEIKNRVKTAQKNLFIFFPSRKRWALKKVIIAESITIIEDRRSGNWP